MDMGRERCAFRGKKRTKGGRDEVGGSKKQGKGREESRERMAMTAVIANSTY